MNVHVKVVAIGMVLNGMMHLCFGHMFQSVQYSARGPFYAVLGVVLGFVLLSRLRTRRIFALFFSWLVFLGMFFAVLFERQPTTSAQIITYIYLIWGGYCIIVLHTSKEFMEGEKSFIGRSGATIERNEGKGKQAKRSVGVTLVAWYLILSGVASIIVSTDTIPMEFWEVRKSFRQLIVPPILLVSFLSVIAGAGLIKLKEWSRKLSIGVAAAWLILLALQPFFILEVEESHRVLVYIGSRFVLWGVVVYILSKRNVKAQFA
jgi:hypothetical protein